MGNKIANRQVICEVLTEHAKEDKEIVVLCSDSRGERFRRSSQNCRPT